VIDILHYYVTFLCSLRTLCQDLPAQVSLVLGFLAGGYVVPTLLAVMALLRWFEGPRAAERFANQQTVLRGLLTALIAWGLAVLFGLACSRVLSDAPAMEAVGGWGCWHGTPYPSSAAAIGFALGAALWRRDWRWGLAACLATSLWAVAQVCCGLRYPLDVVVGAALGAALAWLLGAMAWWERPLGALIRLARRLMLA
jgi:membrane-associated phospholipid phosphatase